MRLYPAAGLQIRDPITHAVIPASGVEVPDRNGIPASFYWQRRLRVGDVTRTSPATTPVAPAKASSASPAASAGTAAATPSPIPATPAAATTAEQAHA
ncbi:DUF2635 domain-containing protein [Novacetimonas sp. GS1]|uniref:DUF2635 domain-containing protein n=1 Tax=Novacetimonas sp. GS1 TaxID=3119990 RepID=UPI002FCCF069